MKKGLNTKNSHFSPYLPLSIVLWVWVPLSFKLLFGVFRHFGDWFLVLSEPGSSKNIS